MSLFMTLFILTFLLLVATVFFLVKRKKYGNKPVIISGIAFVISLAIVIPLGNQPLTEDYKSEASVFTYDRYLNDQVPQGTKVKISGQIVSETGTMVRKGDIFTLKSIGGNFRVKNNNVDKTDLKDGEVLTIYGGYAGTSDNLPAINAQIIEK